jgi:hypothetical protein
LARPEQVASHSPLSDPESLSDLAQRHILGDQAQHGVGLWSQQLSRKLIGPACLRGSGDLVGEVLDHDVRNGGQPVVTSTLPFFTSKRVDRPAFRDRDEESLSVVGGTRRLGHDLVQRLSRTFLSIMA